MCRHTRFLRVWCELQVEVRHTMQSRTSVRNALLWSALLDSSFK